MTKFNVFTEKFQCLWWSFDQLGAGWTWLTDQIKTCQVLLTNIEDSQHTVTRPHVFFAPHEIFHYFYFSLFGHFSFPTLFSCQRFFIVKGSSFFLFYRQNNWKFERNLQLKSPIHDRSDTLQYDFGWYGSLLCRRTLLR
jgi:hypothetical protein